MVSVLASTLRSALIVWGVMHVCLVSREWGSLRFLSRAGDAKAAVAIKGQARISAEMQHRFARLARSSRFGTAAPPGRFQHRLGG